MNASDQIITDDQGRHATQIHAEVFADDAAAAEFLEIDVLELAARLSHDRKRRITEAAGITDPVALAGLEYVVVNACDLLTLAEMDETEFAALVTVIIAETGAES